MKPAKSGRILGMTQAQITFLSISGFFACVTMLVATALVLTKFPLLQANAVPGSTALPTIPSIAPKETSSLVPTNSPTGTPGSKPVFPTPIATQPPTPVAQAGPTAGLLYFSGVNGCEIRWINAQDDSTKKVGNLPLNLCADWNQKTWAPDGTQFALATETGDPGSPFFSIHILSRDGSAAYQLISGNGRIGTEGLYWSPDGQRLAYVLYDYETDLFSINLVHVDGRDHSDGDYLTLTGPPINLSPTAGGAYVSWAPDGQRLAAGAVNNSAAGETGLYLISSLENNFELLLGGGLRLFKPRWSPDGSQILYNDDFYSWKAISLEGDPNPTKIFDAGTFLAWAPDGSEVFALTHPDNGPAQVVAYPGDGSQKPRVIVSENVPDLIGWNPNALWSPDKKMLAFWGLNQDQAYLLDLETSTVRTLSISVRTEESFVWYSLEE
jgi:Tol biopolymer transport system component